MEAAAAATEEVDALVKMIKLAGMMGMDGEGGGGQDVEPGIEPQNPGGEPSL